MLRRHATVLAFLTAMGAATAPAGSAAETVTGQVIDLACYMLDKRNTVPTHTGRGYACAQACAKEGFQVGLLTSNGRVFEIIGGLAANKNAKLIAHMGEVVTIAGDVGKRDGFATIAANDLTGTATRGR
jgi:hypothetical protein